MPEDMHGASWVQDACWQLTLILSRQNSTTVQRALDHQHTMKTRM